MAVCEPAGRVTSPRLRWPLAGASMPTAPFPCHTLPRCSAHRSSKARSPRVRPIRAIPAAHNFWPACRQSWWGAACWLRRLRITVWLGYAMLRRGAGAASQYQVQRYSTCEHSSRLWVGAVGLCQHPLQGKQVGRESAEPAGGLRWFRCPGFARFGCPLPKMDPLSQMECCTQMEMECSTGWHSIPLE